MSVQKSYKGAKVTLSATKRGSLISIGIASQRYLKGANTRFDWRFEIQERRNLRWNYIYKTNTFGYVSGTSGSVRRKHVAASGKVRVKVWFYKKGTRKTLFTLTDTAR